MKPSSLLAAGTTGPSTQGGSVPPAAAIPEGHLSVRHRAHGLIARGHLKLSRLGSRHHRIRVPSGFSGRVLGTRLHVHGFSSSLSASGLGIKGHHKSLWKRMAVV